MIDRRRFLRRGTAALAYGLLARAGLPAVASGAGVADLPHAPGDPLLELPPSPSSVEIEGFPFATWFTGDDFKDSEIPFHAISGFEPPLPSEHLPVAVVGGGISGLATAYLLRGYGPVVFELRDRFGGNATGERWRGIPFSLGSAYVITPDPGSFLEAFYESLGLDRVFRESFPPDPMELDGKILDDFWRGAGMSREEQQAFAKYAEVVTNMAEEAYPEIPLPEDADDAAAVLALDEKTFREDLEGRMGVPLTPLLAAGVQAYFYSSFCAGIDEISAAAGWNFLAAEEYGRWVFPGGNTAMAHALWERLSEPQVGGPGTRLRTRHRVIDVRIGPDGVLVTYVGPRGRMRSLEADQVVMAGSKHICKYVLHDLENVDPAKHQAINDLENGAYLVVNLLLDAPIERDFYDVFLIGDASFPMDPGAFQAERPVVDMLRGDYYSPNHRRRSVLTLYWPWPWPNARGTLLNEGFEPQAARLVAQIREMLRLLELPETAVQQARVTRWGHAVPIARPGFIAGGDAARVQRPIADRIRFVNQDNWALPAIENSLLDARTVAAEVDRALSR